MRSIKDYADNEYYWAMRSGKFITKGKARRLAINRLLEGFRDTAEALDYVSGKRDSELAFYDVWGQEVTAGVVRLAVRAKERELKS